MDYNLTIKHNLKKHGFKHSKVLREAGVSKHAFFYWHESEPRVSTLKRISEISGLTIDQLLEEVEGDDKK